MTKTMLQLYEYHPEMIFSVPSSFHSPMKANKCHSSYEIIRKEFGCLIELIESCRNKVPIS